MQFGACTKAARALEAQAAGWDFLEESVQGYLKGESADWPVPPSPAIPVPTANSLVPGNIPIVGPAVDKAALKQYMTTVLHRAQQVQMHTLVFGSGGARSVPDGFDRNKAVDQITDFLNMSAPIAQAHGVTIVIEPLNKGECNILNTVGEAMTYVDRLKHPNIKCLVDSYHMWLEAEPLSNLEKAMPSIAHVHVADKEGRVAPGESGQSDYPSFFKVLKRGGYDKLIAVECRGFDLQTTGARALKFLQETWAKA
ncbi:MAG: xylose isomerase [Phycisphaerales bacterium]|nr:xylose isomerase [Phycisphaerales bacterium]